MHLLISSGILFMLLLLSWLMPVGSSLCLPQEADLCFGSLLPALVCDRLPQFQLRASPPPVPVTKWGTLGQEMIVLSLGGSCKATKASWELPVVFLNNGKRSPQLALIYSGCASLITFSPQPCCHLKVCHNALERDFFFPLPRKTGKILLVL